MHRFSISTRLTAFHLLVVAIGVWLIITSVSFYFVSDIRSEHDRRIRGFAEYLIGGDSPPDLDSSAIGLLDSSALIAGDINAIVASIIRRRRESTFRFNPPWHFLSDSEGIIYSSDDRGIAPGLFDSVRRLSDSTVNGYQDITVGGTSFRFYRAETDVPGVFLTVIFTWDGLDVPVKRAQTFVLVLLPILIVVLGAGGWFVTKRALRPIEEIRKVTQELTLNDLRTRVQVDDDDTDDDDDEIAKLSKSFNEMLARLQESAEAEHRFIADTAHDIRDPLTVLRSEVEMNALDDDEDEESQESYLRALRQIEYIERLSDDLLMLGSYSSGTIHATPETLSLNDLLLELATDSFPRASQKEIAIRTDLPDEEIYCTGDEMMLRRAIRNLIDNAASYSTRGSNITISLERLTSHARITVADTGPGIASDELSLVGTRAYRGTSSKGTPGSGLGLAIAKEILRLHGGTMEVSSHPGSGTTVTLLIPLDAAALRLP